MGNRRTAGEKGAVKEAAATQGSEQKMDEASFIKKFIEAYKANDQARMGELVRQAEPLKPPQKLNAGSGEAFDSYRFQSAIRSSKSLGTLAKEKSIIGERTTTLGFAKGGKRR